MSLAICSARGRNSEEAYTMADSIFSFSSSLMSYQIGNLVIVVFEDTGNKMSALLDLIRNQGGFHERLVQAIKGSFSFLVYDKITKSLDVFRSLTADPIFYYRANGEFFVSNRLQSLSRFNGDLDEDYFRIYLHTELTEMEYTPYKGIKRLLPAHQVTINKSNGLSVRKFWSIGENVKGDSTLENYIESFSNILKEVVRDSIEDQKNIAFEISGGLDSSSVSCLADQLKDGDSKMYGYTYLFDAFQDGESNKEKVDIIYQNTNITPTYLNLSNYWSLKDTRDGISFYEEPSSLILNFAMYRDLNQFAKERNASVLLSGEGGDELLYVSTHYLRDLLFKGEVKQVFEKVMRLATKNKQPVWKIFGMHLFPSVLPVKLRYKLESQANKITWFNTGFYLNWYATPTWIGDSLKKVTYEEVEIERRKIRDRDIEGIYMKENFERLILVNPCPWINNHIGKPASLKRIYPFRDQRIIEFVFSLPSLIKLEMSRKKRCIRDGLRNTVPMEILTEPDKSSFQEIFRKGLSKETRFVNELIDTSRGAELGWIKKEELLSAIDRFRYGFDHEFGQISKTLGLEIWLRHHGY